MDSTKSASTRQVAGRGPAARELPAERRAVLDAYRDRLARAALVTNLTADRDADRIETRHIQESLALLVELEVREFLPAGAALVDVGSGGGLPGIPIAIARPDLRVTLLEATRKKVAFLESTITELHLASAIALWARAEDAGQDPARRERYDVVVARAVASLDTLAELTLPLVRVGGWVAAVKGSRGAEEAVVAERAIRRCGGRLAEVVPLPAPAGDPLAIVLLQKVAATPAELPRRAGMPAKRPLR